MAGRLPGRGRAGADPRHPGRDAARTHPGPVGRRRHGWSAAVHRRLRHGIADRHPAAVADRRRPARHACAGPQCAGPAAGGLRRRDAGAAGGRAAGAMGRGGDRRLCRLFLGRRAAEPRQRDLRLDLRQSRLCCRGGRLWAQRSCRLFDGRLRAQLCAAQLRPVRR